MSDSDERLAELQREDEDARDDHERRMEERRHHDEEPQRHYGIELRDGNTAMVRMSRPPTPEEVEAFRDLGEAARAQLEKIDTCHERLACPRCKAPVGHLCCAMPKGYDWRSWRSGRILKGAHEERWSQEVSRR